MRITRWSAAIVIVAAFGLQAVDAGPELSLSLGVRGGGEISSNQAPDRRLDVSPAVGLTADIPTAPEKAITALWSMQRTSFDATGILAADDEFDLDVHYIHAGGVYRPSRQSGAQPFVMVTGGFTWVRAREQSFGDSLGLSLMIGGGGTFPINKRLGFRIEGRAFITVTSTDIAGICGGVGCTVAISGTGSLQLEALAGVTYRF